MFADVHNVFELEMVQFQVVSLTIFASRYENHHLLFVVWHQPKASHYGVFSLVHFLTVLCLLPRCLHLPWSYLLWVRSKTVFIIFLRRIIDGILFSYKHICDRPFKLSDDRLLPVERDQWTYFLNSFLTDLRSFLLFIRIFWLRWFIFRPKRTIKLCLNFLSHRLLHDCFKVIILFSMRTRFFTSRWTALIFDIQLGRHYVISVGFLF